MNKRSVLKLSFLIVAIAALTVLLSFNIFAEDIKITYDFGGTLQYDYTERGENITIPSQDLPDEYIHYGWMDRYGNLYTAGTEIIARENMVLYSAFGPTVKNEAQLLSAVNNGCTYIKLGTHFAIDEVINLNDGIFVIDTNGYTLTMNTSLSGIYAKDTGISFVGKGKVAHTSNGTGFSLDGFINLSPEIKSVSRMFITVSEGTTVSTDLTFVNITTNIERYEGAFEVNVYGNLACDMLVRTNGISTSKFTFHEKCTLDTTCNYFFEDISQCTAPLLMSLYIKGGAYTCKQLAGYAQDSARYKASITGGTFSKDITNCFPDKNYVFEYYKTKDVYIFKSCNHNGPVISGMPKSCTTAAYLTFKCNYCEIEYVEAFPNGIGHTEIVTISSNFVTTEKETLPGYYKYYCQRCGNERYEVFFPDPVDVWVNVVIINQKGEKQTIRVPSNMLYSFNGTRLMSFSTEYIQYEYNITQENIISVEIPLGTTEIYGNYQHNAAVGVFCRNPHLQEVVLPLSLKNINQYAFSFMEQLTTITGLENVTGTISNNAFEQYHHKVVLDQMIVNANTIGTNAFKNIRMKALTIGSNVYNIQNGAFALEGDVSLTNEIFVVGNFSANHKNLTEVLGSVVPKNYNSSNQQFGARPIVYLDHQCDVTVYPSTCTTAGYTHYICKYCSYEKIADETPAGAHSFDYENLIHVDATCLDQGYDVAICTICFEEDASTKVPNEARNPNNHSFTDGEGPKFVDINTGAYISDGSVCMNYYYMVGKCKCGAIDVNAPFPEEGVNPPSPTGHTWDRENFIEYNPPTCGEWGSAVVECKVCKARNTAQLKPTDDNHKWGNPVVIKEATCIEGGINEFRCTVCNSEEGTKRVSVKKDPKNHAWDEGVVTKEPTETASGIMTFRCTRPGCRETTTQGIKRLTADHSLPTYAIVLIIVGAVLLAGGVALTLYFTLFKKKKISEGYKYKFNTLK